VKFTNHYPKIIHVMPKSGFFNVFSPTYIAPYYILMEDSICLGYDNGWKETSWLSDILCIVFFFIIALHCFLIKKLE
jgi:hypothetical protein